MSNLELLPGVANIETFAKMFIKSLMAIDRAVNELPSIKDDYSDPRYDNYRQLMNIIGQRVLHLTENILHYLGIGGSFICNEGGMDVDDHFHILSDGNSELAERIGILLDEASGIKKNDVSLVVVSRTLKQMTPGLKLSKGMTMKADAKGTSFTLITGNNISKPQIMFRDKVDNSNQPFFPKIKHKPNAQISLEDSLNIRFSDDNKIDTSLSFPHPYRLELENFVPGKQLLESVVPQVPTALDETPFIMINNTDSLIQLSHGLKKVTEIAVDLEHHSFRSFLGFTCLMQISTRKEDYIVDTLLLRDDLHILNDVFTDPEILKVFHGANSDIDWLQKDFGIYVVNMFDSGQAARTLGFSRFSLAFLLKHYCGVVANKRYQTADWRLRPMPTEMLKYAREDTHYLLYIYDCMKNDLLCKDSGQTSLLLSVFYNSTRLCLKKYEKPQCSEISHEEFYHRELNKRYDEREKGSTSPKKFNNQQMNALKSLYAWRDRVARQQDESTSYVLPSHMLLQICEILPKEPAGIIAICVPKPPIVQSYIDDIHRMILKSRQMSTVAVNSMENYHDHKYSLQLQNLIYQTSLFLDCPHDLSHKTDMYNEFDVTVDFQDELPNGPKMQFRFNGAVQEKHEPDIRMFDNTVLFWKGRKAGNSLDEVVSSFADFFDRFFPSDLLSKKCSVPCSVPSLNRKMLWKLLPDSFQPFDAAHSKLTLSIMKQSPRAFGEKGHKVSLLHEKIYSDRNRTNEDKEQSSLNKHVKMAKGTDSFTRDNFKPYIYENSDIAKFLGETRVMVDDLVAVRKQMKDYDPTLEFASSNLKATLHPRSTAVHGNKTIVYNSRSACFESKPQIQWPKK